MNVFDTLIIGAGPCGIRTAIVLKEAGLNVAIIEGSSPGGKINIAPRVDNYPGFKKIPGPDLAVEFFSWLNEAKVEMIADVVTSLTKENDIFVVECETAKYYAKTVMVASGTKERKLGLPKEEKLFGHGLTYCAMCDGHFFKGKDVLMIGGGNTALKEAIYMATLAHHVYLIHRRNEFRGSNYLVKELRELPNTTVLTPYIPIELIGEDCLEGVKIQNVETKEEQVLVVQGVFPLVGQIPNSQFIKIPGVTNEWGTIPVDNKTKQTSVEGLYAGGDILPRDIRQIYLSEVDGKAAARAIIEYLNK
ncbi:MAG TPA: FAD-dependent oxidoreductase [Erysipelotrichaceae bacterium]|nr:FAD-dependent oxidoreductase [Erysipelotrichaceae bacterium]